MCVLAWEPHGIENMVGVGYSAYEVIVVHVCVNVVVQYVNISTLPDLLMKQLIE